jgi:hypothetical protein
VEVTNSPTYYEAATITTIKSCVVQAPEFYQTVNTYLNEREGDNLGQNTGLCQVMQSGTAS